MKHFDKKILFLLFICFTFSLSTFAQDECELPVITNISNDGPVCEGGTVTLSASGTIGGVASSYVRMAGIGGNYGQRAFDDLFGSGDRPGEITRISEAQFNALAAGGPAALRAQYDVLLFTWNSNKSLNAPWALIEGYLALGGSVFWEDEKNVEDLAPGVIGFESNGSYSCSYNLVSPAPFPSLVANGVSGCFVNHHLNLTLAAWPSWMDVYITATSGSQTFNLAIAGVHPTGGGRLIVQGPDQDYHAVRGAPVTTTVGNQYVFMLNQMDFLAAQQAGISWTGPNGFTSDEASPVISGFTADMAGEYTATLTNLTGGGCSVSASTTVELAGSTTISCPGTIMVNAANGMCGANVPFTVTAMNNDSPISYSHNPNSFFDVGSTTVTASTSSEVCGEISCSFTVMVMDKQAPSYGESCPGNMTLCVPQNVFWTPPTATDNCGITSSSSSHSPGQFFDYGTTTVTYMASDAAGLSATCSFEVEVAPAAQVGIVAGAVPEWCQGVAVLTSKIFNPEELVEPFTYEWSTGESTPNILVAANGPYGLTVTDGSGCFGTASILVDVDLTGILSAHTILVDDEMDMGASTVLSGGVGVQDADEVSIQNGSDITTFFVSASANIDGTSNANNWDMTDSPVDFPDFIHNPFNDSNDETIVGTVTLSGSNYGNVTVKSGSTLNIGNGEMYMKSLTLQKGATLNFDQEGILVIKNKLNIGMMCNVNVEGPGVVVYVGDNAEVGQGLTVAVDIFAPEGLDVADSGSFLTTYMYGLFIADELNSGDNVVWGWNLVCGDFGGAGGYEGAYCGLPTGLPGFPDDLDCEEAICAADAFCCETEWDAICAAAAIEDFAEECAACLSVAPSCDDGIQNGDEEGVDCGGTFCEACPFPPGTGNCFAPNGTPGCDISECQDLICGADPFCCEVEWDAICADAALVQCDSGPVMAEAIGNETESTGNSIGTERVADLAVFPNPTSGVVNIGVLEYMGSAVDIQITNAMGQKVWFQRIGVLETSRIQVNMSDDRFPSGLYNMTLLVNDEVVTKQIILNK